jgi:hypothetical protein
MAFREIQIHNYDFKYTVSKERIVWCKNVYNSLSKLLPIVNNIDWNSYVFNNTCSILELNENNEKNIETKMVTTNTEQKLNYTIFGGSTYELINKKNYKTVNLRDFMDPTGDADIKMHLPMLHIENYNYDITYQVPLIDSQTEGLNNYYKTTFQWCYDQIYAQFMLHDLNKLFPNSVPFDINEYDEVPTEFKDPKFGFNDNMIGNCHLISFNSPQTRFFKIQLVLKIVDNGVTKIDHVMEFVFTVSEYNEIVYNPDMGIKKEEIDYCDEYRIDSLKDLFSSNFEAYGVRQSFFIKKAPKHYHKAMNHISRIIYLLEIAIYVSEYAKYKKIFYNSMLYNFQNENFVNNLLFPEKEEEEQENRKEEEEADNVHEILRLIQKKKLSKEELKAKQKFVYNNLHLYFYKVGSDYKMKLIKLKVSDFLGMFQSKLNPGAMQMFSGEFIKDEKTKYAIFIKKIKENVKNVRTRKFHRSRSVSSVRSEGNSSSRRQQTPEMFNKYEESEPQFLSFEYSVNNPPPSSPVSPASYIRKTTRRNKNKSN